MKKNIIILWSFLLFAGGVVSAQNDDDWPSNTKFSGGLDEFDKFKQNAEKSFSDFRDSANARFARELGKPWVPAKIFGTEEQVKKPKPAKPIHSPAEKANVMPEPKKMSVSTIIPPPPPSVPQEQQMPLPKVPDNMVKASVSIFNQEVTLQMPSRQALKGCKLDSTDEKSVMRMWKSLSEIDLEACIVSLLEQKRELRLNGWGVFYMTAKLVGRMFDDINSRAVATVYLMNQMEYDTKMGRIDDGRLVCMLSSDSRLYGVSRIGLDSKVYYLFTPEPAAVNFRCDVHSYLCTMEGAGNNVVMTVDSIPTFQNAKQQKAAMRMADKDTVEVAINANLIEFYKSYPQVDYNVYANADLDSHFIEAMDKMFRPMVEGKSPVEAVRTLLHFVQYAFDYATDDEQFGYEKPFFCEENFYYPRNDCEDRSILFSRLVRYLLGLDVVLLKYPDHIATAVAFPGGYTVGLCFEIEGKIYVVCDPTYIGGKIGEGQPAYNGVGFEVIMLRNEK